MRPPFVLAPCTNVDDPRVLACAPDAVAAIRVDERAATESDPTDVANRAALSASVALLGSTEFSERNPRTLLASGVDRGAAP